MMRTDSRYWDDIAAGDDPLPAGWRVVRSGGLLFLTLDNPQNRPVRARNLLPDQLGRATGLAPFYVGRTLSLGNTWLAPFTGHFVAFLATRSACRTHP